MRFSIPKSWRKKKLADVADVQTGIAKGKKNIADPVVRPYLRVANVQDGHLDLSEIKTIEVSRHELDRFSLKVGDVLFTEGGDFDKLGRGTVWQGEIPNCLHQNHVFAVRMKNGEMLPYFLATYAASFWGRTYFLSCSKQTTNLASINSTQLKDMPLPVPPLSEQQKIAAILSTWDRAIELTENLIAVKQKRKQALMQQLLSGRTRCEEFLQTTKSNRGTVEHWKHTTLGPHIDLLSGYAFRSDEYSSNKDGVMLLRGDNIAQGRLRWEGVERWPLVATVGLSRYHLEDGDIVLAMDRSWVNAGLKCATVSKKDLPCLLVQRVARLRGSNGLSSQFLYYTLQANRFIQYVKSVQTETAIPHISSQQIREFAIHLPSIPEQEKIVAILSRCDQEIELEESKGACLRIQKKGLMQQLLTGRIRVNMNAGILKG